MRRHFVFLLAFVFAAMLFANFSPARATEFSHARIVRLSYTQGTVEFRENSAAAESQAPDEGAAPGWQKALINTPIREGMSLATGDGRAEVEFESGAFAWISSNSVLEFPQLALADGAKLTALAVKQGTASFYVKAGKHDAFVVRLGDAQVRLPGSARFRVDVFSDGCSITVLRGAVELDANGKLERVESKSTLSLRSGAAELSQMSASPAADGWDRWVADRSVAVETGRYDSAPFVDSHVGYGVADLSYYGGWMTLPGYGYVWQPWGMGAGWSPFFNGYWNNFGPMGPTWISYEPWGWLPYHYGGWVLYPGYGWVWAPGGFGAWSPATVAWVRTPTGVGWVPLAPRETPGRTPANLAGGVVTNTPNGMAARLPNSMLAASSMSSVRVVGAWQNDPELAQMSKQAQLATQRQASGSLRFAMSNAIRSAWQPGAAERMPVGPAPRLSGAALYRGTVVVYHSPAGALAGQSPAARWGSKGWGPPSGAGSGSHTGQAAASGGAASGSSAGASSGSGGTRSGSGGSSSGKP